MAINGRFPIGPEFQEYDFEEEFLDEQGSVGVYDDLVTFGYFSAKRVNSYVHVVVDVSFETLISRLRILPELHLQTIL